MVSNQFYKMKLLALGAFLVLTQGCSQKLGYIQQRQGKDTGIARIFTLREITETATLMASGNYLFATGARGVFGFYDFISGAFISGTSALPTTGTNFIDGNTPNVLSMAQGENFLYVSSKTGLFEININQINYPIMQMSLPYGRPDLSGVLVKESYRFDSMVYVPPPQPTLRGEVWAFRGNEKARFPVGGMNANPYLSREKLPFSTGCNGTLPETRPSSLDFSFRIPSSSAYLQGKVYVAACDGVKILNGDLSQGGGVIGTVSRLNPIQVVATKNYLYVHHQPRGSGGLGWSSNSNLNVPAGIYVLDANLNQVNYIGVEPISFAISPDNQYIYANEDDADVGVYRIPWTNSAIR
jgi:hypothetical protein